MFKSKFKIILFIVISLLFLTSCGEQPIQNESPDLSKSFETILESIPDMIYEGETLSIPNSIDSYNVSYSFDKPEYFTDLKVTKTEDFRNTIVTITITINEESKSKQFKIHQNMEKYFDNIFENIGSNIPDRPSSDDLDLPTSYLKTDTKISYKSNHPDFLSDDGKRIEHDYDENVSITCTLEEHGFKAEKTFAFVSIGISYETRFQMSKELISDFIQNTELKEGTVLPTELPNYGGRFRWVSEDQTVVYDYKTIHLPKVAEKTHLVVEIYFNATQYAVISYEVNLNARPDSITDLDYVKTFIISTLQEDNDYIICYDGSAPDINTDYKVDVNSDNVKHAPYYEFTATSGRPSISQAVLDRKVYEGYTLKNTTNVLWIVTHETGMSYSHQNAEYLGKYQQENAYVEGSSYEASWNYTVDDHSIYLSYDDTVACYHATDGKTEGGGNYNGIGIELCVNATGNFDVAMRNDARLMGYLSIKHSLGILNIKQHYDFYKPKDCPNTIRHSFRWFEYLSDICREVVSQTILKDYTITYSIDLEETGVKGIYDNTTHTLESVVVTINGESFTVDIK